MKPPPRLLFSALLLSAALTVSSCGDRAATGPAPLGPAGPQASLPAGYFVNIVVFEPSGLTFRKPASLTMGYSSCNLLANTGLEIAQVTDDLQIIEYLRSTDDKSAKSVTGAVQHFSNYAVAY